MTKIISAHSIISADNGFSASLFKPADSTSNLSYSEKIVSAVGLRNLF
jgi:hypothetical protein